MGRISENLVDAIHAVSNFWSSPYSKFDDNDLQRLSDALKTEAENLSRTLARKSYPAKDGGGYYEIPKEYDSNTIHEDSQAISEAAKNGLQWL